MTGFYIQCNTGLKLVNNNSNYSIPAIKSFSYSFLRKFIFFKFYLTLNMSLFDGFNETAKHISGSTQDSRFAVEVNRLIST